MGAIHNTHGKYSAQHLKTHTEDVREGEGGERLSYMLERYAENCLNWHLAEMLLKLDQLTFLWPRPRAGTPVRSKGPSLISMSEVFYAFKSILAYITTPFLLRKMLFILEVP